MLCTEHSNGSQIKRPATFRQDTARPTRPSVNIPVPVPPKGALNVASAEQTSIVDVGPVPLLRIRSASPPLEQLNAPRARRDSGVHWLEEAAADTQMQFFTRKPLLSLPRPHTLANCLSLFFQLLRGIVRCHSPARAPSLAQTSSHLRLSRPVSRLRRLPLRNHHPLALYQASSPSQRTETLKDSQPSETSSRAERLLLL